MRKDLLKKPLALLLVTALMFSVTACGGGDKKSSSGDKAAGTDSKNMVFQGEEMKLEGIQGDLSNFTVKNDKLYFTTYEWIEKGSDSEESSEEAGEEGAEETTSEENAEEAEEATSEENAEEAEETSEESTEGTEEATSEENAEEAGEETSEENAEGTDEDNSSDEQEATDEEMDVEIEGETVIRMYSANLDGSNVQEIPLPELGEDGYIYNMVLDNSGNIVFLIGSYDSKTEATSYSVIKIDETGKELAKEDVTKSLNLGQDDYISAVKIDNKDRMIMCLERSVKVLDENFQLVGEVETKDDAWMDGVAVSKDGAIFCAFSGEKEQVRELDVEGKQWGEPVELDISYFPSSDSMMDGSGSYDFYYKDDSGIYGYVLADKRQDKIMDYVASNISSDRSYGIIPVAEDMMLGQEYDESSIFMKYTKVDPSEIKDKTPIVFTAVYVDDRLKSAAIEFNKKSDKYQIQFKDYSNEEDGTTKLSADIIAGNVGDIIALTNLPVDQYAAKGLLEDLTPYFDKDEELNTSDIIPSVYEAMQTDGKLYYIAPGFNMVTLVAKADDVGTEPGWTFDDLKALLDEKGEGVQPFYSNNKGEMLYSFLSAGIEDFIDWQTGECSFDGQDFKDILEICNSYGTNDETEYDEDVSYPQQVKEGKILFQGGWMTMDEIQLYKAMYGADITFIGFPNEEKNGSYFSLENMVGIYAKSDVKEGAWEFIRTLMTKEYQGTSENLYGTPPVRQDCFDMFIKARSATEKYTDELGNEVEPYESGWTYDDLEVQIKPASPEEVEMYRALVDSTTKVEQSDYSLMEIIQEEAKPYFAGEKSLDETVKIIQNRMETYVNENR
ncbi:MAG: extracellular solute-binding protein [Clostridium sp.]|nr:extracellular solute-binding protein [Clostridium sp.]